MKVFEANVSYRVSDFLGEKLDKFLLYEAANEMMINGFGIKNFFCEQSEFDFFKQSITALNNIVEEADRTEYGDFQTNLSLAKSVTGFLKKQKAAPATIIEPTCGKGNFILASLQAFPDVKKITGVEIYKPYTWEAKFKIIDYYLENPKEKKPLIEIEHCNVFDFNFKNIANDNAKSPVLIIGNPPWVTNAMLSSLESGNLPQKSNFKKHNGLDAITGKGNFDIGEYIALMMFDAFHNSNGHFAFLVKNSVIKNIIFDQKQRQYKIANFQKLIIDSRKEFGVSVDAALLFCKLNSAAEFICSEFDFYDNKDTTTRFGWVGNKFVSNIDFYNDSTDIDGTCPFEWRQGIKHDLSAIMELERKNGHFINGVQQEIKLEEELIYGLLKSSDLKSPVIDKTRKFTIVTQKKIGQDTSFIKNKYPETFDYLLQNKSLFDSRKSSIYNNKPDFSIFGVGDYSFKPFKVAISGLYKTYTFSLIIPQNNKPVMLDDTCYLLGFDDIDFAAYSHVLLNSNKAKELLQAITFPDAKRTFTKDILMRIDLYKLALQFSKITLENELNKLNHSYKLNVNSAKWLDFLSAMKPAKVQQMEIFS